MALEKGDYIMDIAGANPDPHGKITKANEKECIELMEHYNHLFDPPDIEITQEPLIVLWHPDCKIVLVVQCQPAHYSGESDADLTLSRANREVNMKQGPLKAMLSVLAGYGTGALAYWKTPVWTIVWRFVDEQASKQIGILRNPDEDAEGDVGSTHIEAVNDL